MAEAEPAWTWKARVRARAADAHGRLGDVRGRLDAVALHLAAPMGVADAAGARNRIQLSQTSLKNVSHQLVVSAALMHAAGIFALHAGNSDNPWEPLPYIHHLGAEEQALQSALTKIACARGHAVDAYRTVEHCRGHLATAFHLLDHPGLADVDVLINRERNLAGTALNFARREVSTCGMQVGLARQDMAGGAN